MKKTIKYIILTTLFIGLMIGAITYGMSKDLNIGFLGFIVGISIPPLTFAIVYSMILFQRFLLRRIK